MKAELSGRIFSDNKQYMAKHNNIKTDVDSQRTLVDKLGRRLKLVRVAKNWIEATSDSMRGRFRPNVRIYKGNLVQPDLESLQSSYA